MGIAGGGGDGWLAVPVLVAFLLRSDDFFVLLLVLLDIWTRDAPTLLLAGGKKFKVKVAAGGGIRQLHSTSNEEVALVQSFIKCDVLPYRTVPGTGT